MDQQTVYVDDTTSQGHETQELRAPAHFRDLLAKLHALSLDQEQQLGLGKAAQASTRRPTPCDRLLLDQHKASTMSCGTSLLL